MKAKFGDRKFQQKFLADFLSLEMPKMGFLARGLGYTFMQLKESDAAVQTAPAALKPLTRKRSHGEYAADALTNCCSDPNSSGAAKRRFDVLTRQHVGDVQRECATCGRVSDSCQDIYRRWDFACPMSGGRWRRPLHWHWELESPEDSDKGEFVMAPPP